jgi:hypothetical protein
MKIYQLTGYTTSKDYKLLFELMQKTSVICIIDYDFSDLTEPSRDIAKTAYKDGDYQIGARGISYLWAETKDEFVRYCERQNVEFIPPGAEDLK